MLMLHFRGSNVVPFRPSIPTAAAALLLQVSACIAQETINPPTDRPQPPVEKTKPIGQTQMTEDKFKGGNGHEIEQELSELYRSYLDRTDNDFGRAFDEIHEKRRSAKRTQGYRDLRGRLKEIKNWRHTYQSGYQDRLENLKEQSPILRDAIDNSVKGNDKANKTSEKEAVERALRGELGPFDTRTTRLMKRLIHMQRWTIRLQDAERRLEEGVRTLEDTSEPYASAGLSPIDGLWKITSKSAHDGSVVRCSEQDGSFVCVYDQPSQRATAELGLKPGDLSMRGKLSRHSVSGEKYFAFRPDKGDNCPNMNGNLPYEMRNAKISADGSKIKGERKFPVYFKRTCAIVDTMDIWLPFEYHKVM